MRISDWSSDVCSSDLLIQWPTTRHANQWGPRPLPNAFITKLRGVLWKDIGLGAHICIREKSQICYLSPRASRRYARLFIRCTARAERKRVVSGTSVTLRVYLGGLRTIKKKRKQK